MANEDICNKCGYSDVDLQNELYCEYWGVQCDEVEDCDPNDLG